jgi:hypothetical protein
MKMFSAKPPGSSRDRVAQKYSAFSPQNTVFSLFISFSPFGSLELVTTKAFHQKNELLVRGREKGVKSGSSSMEGKREDKRAGCLREEGISMGDMKSLRGFDWGKDWATWRANVKERIAVAHKFGVSDETVRAIATKVGDLLAEKSCPATQEEELLKEMWNVATPDERKTITALIFKMVQ